MAMIDSTRRATRDQVDRLFWLIAMVSLGLVALKGGVSAVKSFSDGEYWQASLGLVIFIVGVSALEFLHRAFARSRRDGG